MPTTPPRPCLTVGCPELVSGGRYCPKHRSNAAVTRQDSEKRRQDDPVLAANARFRSSAAWQKVRRRKMAMNPLCEDPYRTHRMATVSARQIHHIRPLATHYHLRLSLENLMSVCTGCHARLERDEQKKIQ